MPQETSSHLYTASCFEDNYFGDEDTTETTKQPLLSDGDSTPQKSVLVTSCKNEERRLRTMIVKILLVGIAAGLVLQTMTFSAFVTILKVWGRDPQPQDLSNRAMYYILFLLSQADIAVYFLLTVMFIFLSAKSGSIYRRKKFDHEDGTSTKKEGSIWYSRQFMFRAGITFLFGVMFGSFSVWAAVDYEVGMPLSLGPLVTTLILDLMILPVMFKCFGSAQEGDDETSTDEEQAEGGAI
jgi:hypothetical protein